MARRHFLVVLFLFLPLAWIPARPPIPSAQPPKGTPARGSLRQDDSVILTPAKDLLLRPEGEHKATALSHFVEGNRLEEEGEMEGALAAYQRVLNLDPGQAELALRVASLLVRQEEFPRAIDVLKDAVKANPKEPGPYLQLAFIYAKYLKKTEQALKYANQAIEIDPENIEAYQRLYEIELATGDPQKAMLALDRAAKRRSDDPAFLTRLGRLYAALILKPDADSPIEELSRLNEIFKTAVAHADDDPAILKEVADYYALSDQIQEAIPLYLKILELQPDDPTAREKLAAGFMVTNQREKAIGMLEEIIRLNPAKYQPYELLAQLFDEAGRARQRENQPEEALPLFAKAASNYEQSLLINPSRGTTYLRLAELLVGPVKQAERAVKVLGEARSRFPEAPEFTYFLAVALREAKQPKQAVITFEEALQEAEINAADVVTARFYFEYGATAEQAGLYDKAADLFQKCIAMDPANAAEACNYLGYMWAERNMHLDQAGEMIKRALELDPNNGAYLDSLGWLHYRQGKFEEALKALLRAAQTLPKDDPVVFEHLGDTCAKLERLPQALDYWQKSLSLNPANKAVADKIESMKTRSSLGRAPRVNPIQ